MRNIKDYLRKSKCEKLIRISQLAVNLSVVLALSPMAYAALKEISHKLSGCPERLKNAIWKYLSEGSV